MQKKTELLDFKNPKAPSLKLITALMKIPPFFGKLQTKANFDF